MQASFKLREEGGAVAIDNAVWRDEGFMPLTAAVSDMLAHMNELKQHKVVAKCHYNTMTILAVL
jgi:hypothetical protein